MELSVKRLISRLRRAKKCTLAQAVAFDGEVNLHLFERYLMPFLRDEFPCVGDLDFSQFTVEDVQEFEQYLDKAGKTSVHIFSFLNEFAKAEPVAERRRTFC